MSIPERLFKISKAYLGQVRDRIDSELAERELEASLREANGPNRDDTSSDAMMRRAEERIAAMRREIDARNTDNGRGGAATATAPDVMATVTPTAAGNGTATMEADPNAKDFRVMGVPVGSDLATVQAAYEKLARRCDPRRFPDGSSEQQEAERILAKVNISYEALKTRLDPMQNRFGKLELE